MVKIKPPAKKKKGLPPAEEAPSVNLTKISDKDLVAINFKVPAEFKKTFKQYAAELGIPMTGLLIRSVNEYRKRY